MTDVTLTQQSHASVDAEGLATLLLALHPRSAFQAYAHGAHLRMDKAILSNSNMIVSGGYRHIGHRAPAISMIGGRSSSGDEEETAVDSSLQLSRREMLGLAALLPVLPAGALFESKEQLAMTKVASLKPKIAQLLKETAELKRKRLQYATANLDVQEDDYRLRFTRAEIEPQVEQMVTAANGLKSSSAAALPDQFKQQVKKLDYACRRRDIVQQYDALASMDKTLGDFVALGSAEKFDVKAVNEVNIYNQMAPYIYNPLLFKQVPKAN